MTIPFDPRPIGIELQFESARRQLVEWNERHRTQLEILRRAKQDPEYVRLMRRMCQARLRAERRGQDTSGFPPRRRQFPTQREVIPAQSAGPKPATSRPRSPSPIQQGGLRKIS